VLETPEPPALSVADSPTVTVPLFEAAFEHGPALHEIVVVGATVSVFGLP
jgi:hypothetical protein